MKKILVMLLCTLMLTFAFCSIASAEQASFFAEYNMDSLELSIDPLGSTDMDINALTIGGEYSDKAVFGIWYTFGMSYDPDYADASFSSYNVYGGYNFVNTDQGSFGAILGYFGSKYEDIGTNLDGTSLGIGFKGAIKAEQVDLALTYLYGLSNELSDVDDDVDASLIDFSVGYHFNDSFCMYLGYRSISFEYLDALQYDYSGVNLGFKWLF